MSDVLTSYSSYLLDNRVDDDNLVDFLTKLSRFGLDQCSHLTHHIVDKQRLLHNENIPRLSTRFQDKLIRLKNVLREVHTMQNGFYQIMLAVSSATDNNKQLLFSQLQTYLANFVEISLRLKSLDIIPNGTGSLQSPSIVKPPSDTLELSTAMGDCNLSMRSSFSLVPAIVVSSSFSSDEDICNEIDVGKSWKFATIVRTRFEVTLIASNSHIIACYNSEHNILSFILVTGQFQASIKWHYKRIVDIVWCSLIDRYVAVTRFALYTIKYDRQKALSSSNPVIVNKVIDLNVFDFVRIVCNQHHIYLYTVNSRSSSIHIYDSQFLVEKIFDSSIDKQLPIGSPTFCCSNTLFAMTQKEELLVSLFPYVNPKKISLLLFDIDTLELRYNIDLLNCSDVYSMKCLERHNIFFVLAHDKILWMIKIDTNNETIQMAKKTFYTNQTEMCVFNDRHLLLINVNAGCSIQLIKYRKVKQ